MSQLAYIQKNYPVATINQLQESRIMQSDDVYVEEGLKKDTEFVHLFKRLNKGDTLVVYSLKVLFMMKDYIEYLKFFAEKNIRLIAIEENIDTKVDVQFYEYILLMFDIKSECRSDYIKEILVKKKSQGVVLGRPKLTEEQINEIQYLRRFKKRSYREIAKVCGVSLGSVNKYASDKVLDEVFAGKA